MIYLIYLIFRIIAAINISSLRSGLFAQIRVCKVFITRVCKVLVQRERWKDGKRVVIKRFRYCEPLRYLKWLRTVHLRGPLLIRCLDV